MKIILSRKGMDSGFAEIPSPIIQNENGKWELYSLPIPSPYSDIKYNQLNLFKDFTLAKFIGDVNTSKKNLVQNKLCHLDPDIRKEYYSDRSENWKPNFGQVKSAQSHLKNQKIDCGDVFIFFGWFKKAELKNGKFQYIYDENYPNGFHAIYAYLQIDKIYKPNLNMNNVPEWLNYHPHVKYKDEPEFNHPNNTIYVSSKEFKHRKINNKTGSGTLNFSDDLILTKKGQPYRTLWELPQSFHPKNKITLSYHNNLKRWSIIGQKTNLKSVSRGQEFVFNENELIEEWCCDLINSNS
jgi:hypothetical protein